MTPTCAYCDGACADADLAPLLVAELAWLWEQLAAAADRQGDAMLLSGSVSVRLPTAAEARAAGAGLLGGRPLRARGRRRIDLAELTKRLHVRGGALTPGAVAAHAVSRRLATRSIAEVDRARLEEAVRATFRDQWPTSMVTDKDHLWMTLRRAGWIARALADPNPRALMHNALAVLSLLPSTDGDRIDRRRLAADAVGNPHGLDDGTTLGGLVIATNVALGRIPARMRRRSAWVALGVDCDDVVGGLLAVGIVPNGWQVPNGAVVTLPPRVLRSCTWPQSADDQWIFVTENPSVLAAAADLAAAGSKVRMLCTNGTPSSSEVSAIATLATQGWRIAVRADFDAAGIRHVAFVLAKVPNAVPWRMRSSDYLSSVADRPELAERVELMPVPKTPWDPELASLMMARGIATFEEVLLNDLLDDVRRNAPAR